MAAAKVNLHIFLSPFTHESRALKESRSLIDAGLFDEVLFAALWQPGLKEREQFDSARSVWRVRLSTKGLPVVHFLKYFEWASRIVLQTRGCQVSVVHVHSLNALPAGVIFKWLRRSKLVYDAHELETESNGLTRTRKAIYKIVEHVFMPQVDVLLVVGESIADWYKQHYPIANVWVVKNVPDLASQVNVAGEFDQASTSNVLKVLLEIPENHLLFIYQGGIFKGRGIQILLDAFSKAAPEKHIVFMGYGELENLVQECAAKHSNIHFQPAVPPDQVISYTKAADVGISLIENTCLSYYYCLPNKVFEYMAAGLPMIVSDFPEMAKLVDQHSVGWKTLVEVDAVVSLIQSITPEALASRKAKVHDASQLYGWKFEQKKLIGAYRSVLDVDESSSDEI